MAGRLDFYMAADGAGDAAGRRPDGCRRLAVASAKRSIALPEVPTTTEAGFANSDYEFWVGAFAPAATPRTIIDRLNQRDPQGAGDVSWCESA